MSWQPVTLDHVRALVQQARIDRAADADGDGQMEVYFRLYHDGTVAAIRARLSESHTLDANPTLLPPEFVMLAALRIAAILLGRPGPTGSDQVNPYSLTVEQNSELKRLEAQLEGAAAGKPITTTDAPAATDATTDASPAPSVTAPTRYWSRDSQDGIGAY